MHTEATKESLLHTLRGFWTGKRFLKLLLFSLLLAELTTYCVGKLARRQVTFNAVRRHDKIYSAYLTAVARLRKTADGSPATAQDESRGVGTQQSGSIYWAALGEVRHQYPQLQLDILVSESPAGEEEKHILEALRSREYGWVVNEENGGFIRSFYQVPAGELAAFHVSTDSREDFAAWETTALVMGGYAFVLLLVFAWFWTRELDERQLAPPAASERILEIRKTMAQVGAVLADVQAGLLALESARPQGPPACLRDVDDAVAQIRLLAVNGSLEAARSAESYRVFHVLMSEINQLATAARSRLRAAEVKGISTAELRDRIATLRRAVSGAAADASRDPDPSVSFRRVG